MKFEKNGRDIVVAAVSVGMVNQAASFVERGVSLQKCGDLAGFISVVPETIGAKEKVSRAGNFEMSHVGLSVFTGVGAQPMRDTVRLRSVSRLLRSHLSRRDDFIHPGVIDGQLARVAVRTDPVGAAVSGPAH